MTPDEAMFIDDTDTSGEQNDALFIAEEIKWYIQLLEEGNIVQIVTDSAANCRAACTMLSK